MTNKVRSSAALTINHLAEKLEISRFCSQMLQDTGGAKPQQEGGRKLKIDFRVCAEEALYTLSAVCYDKCRSRQKNRSLSKFMQNIPESR